MNTVLYLNASNGISGAERSLLAMLDALDRTRWQPLVMAPEGPLLREVARRHIATIPAPLTPLTRPRDAGAYREMLQRLHTGWQAVSAVALQVAPAVLHANTTTAMLYAARLPRIPCVWHVRDLAPLGTLGRWLYRRAARIAVISTAVQQSLVRYARDGGQKILLLPPAIRPIFTQPRTSTPYARGWGFHKIARCWA
jgi:UDP-N-acetylglucosamine:LPS N-acetylglucosamine transferase